MSIYVLIWIDRNKSAYVSDKIPELVQRKHPIMTYLLTEGQPGPRYWGQDVGDITVCHQITISGHMGHILTSTIIICH